MIFRIPYILLFAGALLSCSTGPEFERNNVNDPQSKSFGPDVGELIVSIDSTKNVTLQWNNISDFEDGFIVQKSFDDKESFFDLDTLPANSTSFIDSTKKLAVDTFYRVRPFSHGSDSLGSTEIDKLILNPLDAISVPNVPGNEISVFWEINNTGYADAYLIEKKTINSADWKTVDTVLSNQYNYSFVDLTESYFIDIKISALLETNKMELKPVHSISKSSVGYNLPSKFEAEIIDEETILVNWQDNSLFDEKFIIYQRPASNQFGAGISQYIPIDTLTNSEYVILNYSKKIFYDLNISPFYGSMIGNIIEPLIFTLVSTRPSFREVKSVSESELTLEWSDNNVNYPTEFRFPTKRFILEQSINEGDFVQIDEISHNKNSYTLSNLNKTKQYKFKIRSLASDYDEIRAEYEKSLIITTQFPLGPSSNYPYRLRPTPTNNSFVYEYARHAGGSYSIRFINKISGNLEREIVFDSDFRGYTLSKDEKYLAIFGGDAPGVYQYSDSDKNLIYDNLDSVEGGVFINNEELIISGAEKTLVKVNISTNSEIVIEEFPQFDSGFQIYEIYPYTNINKIYLLTSAGTLIYDLSNKITKVIKYPNTAITDVNNKGEILLTSSDEILLMNEEELLQKFSIPSSINNGTSNIDAASAKFLDDNHIIVSTRTSNQSVLFVYERGLENYISYNLGQSLIAVDTLNKKTVSINQYMRGNGYIFSFNENWTRY